jgi:hypothetical protein
MPNYSLHGLPLSNLFLSQIPTSQGEVDGVCHFNPTFRGVLHFWISHLSSQRLYLLSSQPGWKLSSNFLVLPLPMNGAVPVTALPLPKGSFSGSHK